MFKIPVSNKIMSYANTKGNASARAISAILSRFLWT